MENKIVSIAILILSAVVGFGGGFLANKLYKDDDDKIIKMKLITKTVALLGVVAALLTSLYL
jgi:hypothetical protein